MRTTERLTETEPLALDLLKIEAIGPLTEAERLAGPMAKQTAPLEIVMHFDVQTDFGWEDVTGANPRAEKVALRATA